MKKQFIKIGMALLVLIAVAIPLSLYREKKFKQEEAKDTARKFFQFEPNDVDRIDVVNSSGTVELKKRKKIDGKYQDDLSYRDHEFSVAPDWMVMQPYHAYADSLHSNTFFNQIRNMEYQKVIQEDKTRMADYGLDHPKITLRFFDAGQSEAKLTLTMGDENPTGTGFYFMASDKPGIYLGERLLQPYSEELPKEWRERRIFESPDINLIYKVSTNFPIKKQNGFEAEMTSGTWKFSGAYSDIDVDQAGMKGFVDHLNAMRAREVFDTSSVINKSKQLATIDFYVMGQSDPVHFTIYDGGDDKDTYFIKRADLPEYFSVATDPKLVFSYHNAADKRLFTKSVDDLASIRVTSKGVVYNLIKEKNTWRATSPFKDEASFKRIESFFNLLIQEDPMTYEVGKVLSDRDRQVLIEYTTKDNAQSSVAYYKDAKGSYARITENGKTKIVSIINVPKELFEDIAHFRNVDLISLPDEDLNYITFERNGMKVELEKKKRDYHWFVKTMENVSPAVNMKWKESPLPDQVYLRASQISIQDFVEHPDPKATYDTATLKLATPDHTEFTWKFGKRHGDMIDVFSPERNVVGRVSWQKYNEIAQFLDEPEKTKK